MADCYQVTFEVIGVVTVEAQDEHAALALVSNYGGDELVADSQIQDVFIIGAHRV